jgi:SAM-dependent methyltransferase
MCGLDESYRLLYCPGCDLGFVDPMPTPAELTEFYASDAYFEGGHEGFGFENQKEVGDGLRVSLLTGWPYLDRLEEIVPSRGSILDVGCGTGFRLSVAKERGWDAQGVELSEYASGVGRDHYGLQVKNCRLAEADFAPESFDAIMINAVLEHVPDPVRLLSEASALLRPGGGMAILLPHYGSPRAKMRGAAWNEIRPPEHLTFHSHASIRAMAERSGLQVEAISSHPRYHVTPAELPGCVPGPGKVAVKVVEKLGGQARGVRLQERLIGLYHRSLQYPLITAWFRK